MNQDSDTPSKPSSPTTSDDGSSSFDDDFIDVGNNENTNDAYCVVANQSGSRVGVGHSGGFKLFEVKKVTVRASGATSPPSNTTTTTTTPPVPPYQLVELFRFEGFSGTGVGGGTGTQNTIRIGGKGIGQMALLHDTMFVGAVGAGPYPAASPNVVLLFSRTTLETTLEYPAPVTRLMIARDMVFTLTSDQFFTIRTFKGATLMRVSTHTLNTPADQPLAIDSYRNFIAYPDAKIGSFSVANFADPKNIRIVCQNRAAHHHTLTGLALGQATLATPATTKSTPQQHRDGSSASSASAPTDSSSTASYEATVCVTCSLHGTLVRVWDVTEDANPFPTSSKNAGGSGGRFAGIMLCELRASTAPCHIRHLGLNKRSYLYVLMANELKIFFIGKTEKRKPSDVSLTTAEQIKNKESLLKRLDFVSSYFASQWAACSVGLPSGGLFLPPWAPKGKIKCLERAVVARHGSGGSHRGAGSTSTGNKKDGDHDDAASLSSFFRGTYAQWITPETADAARDAVKHSTTAALAALATAFNYASNTSVVRAAMTGELSDRFYRALPPLPSGEPRPDQEHPHGAAGGHEEVLHGAPTPSPVPAGVAEGGATWTSGLQSLWSYTSASAASYTSPTGNQKDGQTGGAVQFPSIPGVHYDPSLSGKQLDDLICLWWESEQAMDLRRSVEWGDEEVQQYAEFQHQQDVDLREVYVAKPAWVKVTTTPAMTSTVEEEITSDAEDNDHHRNNETSDSDADGGTFAKKTKTVEATPPPAAAAHGDDTNNHHHHHRKAHAVEDKHGGGTVVVKPHQPLFGDPSVLYDNSSSSVAAVASAGGHPLSTTNTSNVDFIWSANANGDLVRVGFRPLGGKLTVHRVVPAKTL